MTLDTCDSSVFFVNQPLNKLAIQMIENVLPGEGTTGGEGYKEIVRPKESPDASTEYGEYKIETQKTLPINQSSTISNIFERQHTVSQQI